MFERNSCKVKIVGTSVDRSRDLVVLAGGILWTMFGHAPSARDNDYDSGRVAIMRLDDIVGGARAGPLRSRLDREIKTDL